ncbi:MAG: helix-turn-helix domain-containing protein [Parvularculaceae bacterium]
MINLRRNLAENLRKRRGKLTQSKFARKAGITQPSLNRIEQGEQNVTLDTLQRICERLKCKPSDLLDPR